MKLDLGALKYLYDYLSNNDKLQEEISDFNDFIDYVIGLIFDNIEYDYNINFSDYVDLNRFIVEE